MHNRLMHRRDQFSERQLIALGIGALVLHGSGSTAWAAYVPQSEVPVPNALTETLFAIAVAVAIGLYALRCWWRSIYGLIEIIAATFIIYLSIVPAKQPGSSICNGNALFGLGCGLQSVLIVLAGIYVFVRGLDNMEPRRLWSPVRASWQQYRAASRKTS